MRIHNRIGTLLGMVGLGTLLTLTTAGWTQDPPRGAENEAGQEGVEPLTRGPIHEAFAAPVDAQPGSSPVVPREPPAPLEELPPDQKPEGENVEWVPGYWSWDEERKDFIWVSGFWRAPPPGRRWLPGRWQAVDGGYQWVPGLWTEPQQTEMQYLPPPPESAEIGPSVPAPNDNCIYTPGSWVYQETRYRWRPGTWIDYRPGWVWVPPNYCWTPCGYVYQGGYWDYELAQRGLLFSPVFIAPQFRLGVGWHYRPRYVVNCDFLYGSLFIRPSWRHYYFGDWFDGGYRNRGYVPWVDYRIGRYGRDPLYNHYRVGYRNDGFWNRGINDLYAGRFRGDVPRPPRTFVQQNTQIKNVSINRNVNVNNINVTNLNNVAAIGAISQVDRTAFKLQQVTSAQQKAEQQAAAQLRNVSRERARVESQLLAQGGPPTKSNAPPRTAKLDVAGGRPVRPATVKPPPPPPVPVTTSSTPKKDAALGKEAKPPAKAEVKGGPPKVDSKPPVKEGKPSVKPMPKEVKPEVKPPVKEGKPIVKPVPKEVKPDAKPPAKEGKPSVKPAPKEIKPAAKPPVKEGKPIVNPPPKEVKPPPRPEVKPSVKPEVKPPRPEDKPRRKPPEAANVTPPRIDPAKPPQLIAKPAPTPPPAAPAAGKAPPPAVTKSAPAPVIKAPAPPAPPPPAPPPAAKSAPAPVNKAPAPVIKAPAPPPAAKSAPAPVIKAPPPQASRPAPPPVTRPQTPPPAARSQPPPSSRPVAPARPQTPPPSKPGGKK